MTTIRQPPTRSKWGTAVGVAADAGGGEMKGASQLGHRSPGFVTVVKQAGQRTYRAIEPAAGTVSCTGSVLPQARQRPASVVFAPQNGHGCVRSVTADVASMFSSGPWMKPAALSYVRSARLVNSNLHGARYRAAGARPGRSPRAGPPVTAGPLPGPPCTPPDPQRTAINGESEPWLLGPVQRATTADCSDSHSRRCCSAVQCTWQYPDGCNVVFRQRRPPSVRITPEQVVRRCVRAVCGITPTPELIPRCPYTQRTVRAQARLHQRSEVQRRTAHTVLRVPRTVECRGQGS